MHIHTRPARGSDPTYRLLKSMYYGVEGRTEKREKPGDLAALIIRRKVINAEASVSMTSVQAIPFPIFVSVPSRLALRVLWARGSA